MGDFLGPMFQVVAGDAARAFEALGLDAGKKVLDVGTGSGHCAIYLAARGCDVVTGEPADDGSMYARRDWEARAEQVGVRDRIRFQSFDASAMPFESGSFDAVFLFGMLHHVREDSRAGVMREALRVVKGDGPVVFFEPGEATLELVRQNDPSHPDAANPGDYTSPGEAREQRLDGAWMKIYVYRKPQ